MVITRHSFSPETERALAALRKPTTGTDLLRWRRATFPVGLPHPPELPNLSAEPSARPSWVLRESARRSGPALAYSPRYLPSHVGRAFT